MGFVTIGARRLIYFELIISKYFLHYVDCRCLSKIQAKPVSYCLLMGYFFKIRYAVKLVLIDVARG